MFRVQEQLRVLDDAYDPDTARWLCHTGRSGSRPRRLSRKRAHRLHTASGSFQASRRSPVCPYKSVGKVGFPCPARSLLQPLEAVRIRAPWRSRAVLANALPPTAPRTRRGARPRRRGRVSPTSDRLPPVAHERRPGSGVGYSAHVRPPVLKSLGAHPCGPQDQLGPLGHRLRRLGPFEVEDMLSEVQREMCVLPHPRPPDHDGVQQVVVVSAAGGLAGRGIPEVPGRRRSSWAALTGEVVSGGGGGHHSPSSCSRVWAGSTGWGTDSGPSPRVQYGESFAGAGWTGSREKSMWASASGSPVGRWSWSPRP